METTMLDAALSQGIWAVVAVFLLIYVVKSNEQRDKKQEERENNYQSVIEKLTEKYQKAALPDTPWVYTCAGYEKRQLRFP